MRPSLACALDTRPLYQKTALFWEYVAWECAGPCLVRWAFESLMEIGSGCGCGFRVLVRVTLAGSVFLVRLLRVMGGRVLVAICCCSALSVGGCGCWLRVLVWVVLSGSVLVVRLDRVMGWRVLVAVCCCSALPVGVMPSHPHDYKSLLV